MVVETLLGAMTRIDDLVELLKFVLERFGDHTRTVGLVTSKIGEACRETAIFFGVPAQREVIEGIEKGIVETGACLRRKRSCLEIQ